MGTLVRDTRFSRAIRRPLWKAFYNQACRGYLPDAATTFLNLGYLSDPGELGSEDTPEIADRVCERLYDNVVGGIDLAGRAVVEVGCGAGAGSAYLAGTRHPASFVGIDLNKNLIAWCQEHHHATNLQFMQGDAQDLPIASDSVDAVVNVESSHCYPSRPRFFGEVVRILRPGGSFLYADLVFARGEGEDVISAQMSEAGLAVEACVDITENVLLAREALSRSPSFRSRLRANTPPRMLTVVESSYFLVGTSGHERMASREVRYVQWRAVKPTEGSVASSIAGAAVV